VLHKIAIFGRKLFFRFTLDNDCRGVLSSIRCNDLGNNFQIVDGCRINLSTAVEASYVVVVNLIIVHEDVAAVFGIRMENVLDNTWKGHSLETSWQSKKIDTATGEFKCLGLYLARICQQPMSLFHSHFFDEPVQPRTNFVTQVAPNVFPSFIR